MTKKDFGLLERLLKPIKTPSSSEFKLLVVIVAVLAFEQIFYVYASRFITPDWLSVLIGRNQGEYGPASEKTAAAILSASVIAVSSTLECTIFVAVCRAFSLLRANEHIFKTGILKATLRVLAILIVLLFISALLVNALVPAVFLAEQFLIDLNANFDLITDTTALANAPAYIGEFISLYLFARIGASLVNTALGAAHGIDKIWRTLGKHQAALLIGVLVLFALRWLTQFLYKIDVPSALFEPINKAASYYLLYRLFTIAEKQLEIKQ